MAGGIEVPIDGDISPLLATFAELPGRTQDEMRAVGKIIQDEATKGQIYKGFLAIEGVSEKSAKRATAAVLKEMQAAAKDAERTTAAAAKAAEAATNDVKKAATVMFGGVVGDIEDMVGMLGSIGPVGAAGIGAFGAALAASGVVAGVVELERAAGEAVKRLDELAEFGLDPIDPAMRESIEEANAALDAFYVVMDQVVVQLGASLAPTIIEASVAVGGLAISFGDLVEETLKTQTAMQFLTNYVGSTLIQGLMAPVTMVADLAERLGDVGELLGLQNNVLKTTGQAYDDWTFSLAQGAQTTIEAANAEDDFNGVLLTSEDRFSMTADAVRRSRQEKEKHTAATRAQHAAVEAEKKATKEAAEWEEQYAYEQAKNAANWIAQQQAINRANDAPELDRQRRLAWLAEYDKKAAQLAADEVLRAQTVALAQQQAALQTASQWGSTIQSLGGLFEQLSAIIIGNAEDGSEAQKKAALVSFRINQAASIAAITINTAVAIIKAFAELGPGLGAIAAIGIGATGLAQAAAVAATPPPTFHVGGVVGEPGRIGNSGANAPDEVMVRARRGERVVPRGQDAAPAPMIVMQYNHRLFDLAEGDRAKRVSPYRSLAMHGKTVGRK